MIIILCTKCLIGVECILMFDDSYILNLIMINLIKYGIFMSSLHRLITISFKVIVPMCWISKGNKFSGIALST